MPWKLNLLVRPLLVILTLPITILTLGLFWLVINAVIFQWAGRLVEGVHVATFGSALVASFFVSSVSWLAHALTRGGGAGPRVRVMWRRQGAREVRREEPIELHERENGKWE